MSGPRRSGGRAVGNHGPFRVFLSELDWANPLCHYAFPTRRAAQRFADNHKTPGRVVLVREQSTVSKSGHGPTK
jgi:hypothetical protein